MKLTIGYYVILRDVMKEPRYEDILDFLDRCNVKFHVEADNIVIEKQDFNSRYDNGDVEHLLDIITDFEFNVHLDRVGYGHYELTVY